MAVTGQRMMLADFLRMPEAEPALELYRGVVSQKVAAKGPHGAIQFELGRRIADAGDAGEPVRVFTETRINLDVESFVPDLIVYREQRVPSDDDNEISDDFFDPPDLAVEVISPGQVLGTLRDRCRDMARLGVGIVLLIVPRSRTVWVFRAETETGPLAGEAVIELTEIVSGLRLTVNDIFSPLRARRSPS
jgi:Uma2 family endonuclease